MNYEEAIEKIHSFQVFGSRLGLERMEKLLQLLGEPQRDMRIIHVAGTNGKGSVCRYVYSVLQAQGYRTGIYVSPYIERFTERIEFDGAEISGDDLARHTQHALAAVERMTAEGFEPPTEFELVTAVGLTYFAEKKADFVILEVGLGGRGDSTNICDAPLVTAITSISYDHMQQLGNTLEEIAGEKAGILKRNVPAVVFAEDPGAFGVIQQRAQELGAPLIDVRNSRAENITESLDGCCFDAVLAGAGEKPPRGGFSPAFGAGVAEDTAAPAPSDNSEGTETEVRMERIRLSMAGRHQISNALCALNMIEVLREKGVAISDIAIRSGMERARQKGRLEVMRRQPHWLILDGAHNPAGAEALTDTILSYFKGRKILLCTGVLEDKPFREMARIFARLDADIIVTDVPNPRTLKADEYAAVFRCIAGYAGSRRVASITGVKEAFWAAESKKDEYDLILWAGSLYLIGEIRRIITCSR